jgi:hypothetical protein
MIAPPLGVALPISKHPMEWDAQRTDELQIGGRIDQILGDVGRHLILLPQNVLWGAGLARCPCWITLG